MYISDYHGEHTLVSWQRTMNNEENPKSAQPASNRSMGKRKAFAVFLLIFGAVMLTIVNFYQAKLLRSGGTMWFLGATIIIGVWLIAGMVRVLRKR